MKRIIIFLLILGSGLGLFLFLRGERSIDLSDTVALSVIDKLQGKKVEEAKPLPDGDIPNQKPLQNPPSEIKAVYITNWTASSDSGIGNIIKLIRETELNAVVIDIKDYSGFTGYNIQNEEIDKCKAKEVRIKYLNQVIKRFHDEGIYLIGRITIFQDPLLAQCHPDWGVQSKANGGLWKDRKGLSWMDPSSKEVWDYNIAIAKDITARGFDEVNFDYIRFPSDGNLTDMAYPSYDGVEEKHLVIRRFFEYLRNSLSNTKISADLFGMTTYAIDDLGIGQIIEDAYAYFDYVCPMVYPSHYVKTFIGYKNPAEYPYEVVKYSLEAAIGKLNIANNKIAEENNLIEKEKDKKPLLTAKLRPWLQDFDLGADYDATKVRAQITAVYDLGIDSGWLLWDPRNVYTRDALNPE